MLAGKMALFDPEYLLGQWIMTKKYGDWPGGVVEIIQVHPDPAAPEIVFQVKHPEHGEIGVFNFEEVEFAKTNLKED